jgi:hypothetical protein
MNLLPSLFGVTVVLVNVFVPAVTVNVASAVLPEETSVCGVKIGDVYCRSGDVFMLWETHSQF